MPDKFILRHARLVLPARLADDACVIVERGRIAQLFEGTEPPRASDLPAIDLSGLTLYPGFIDLHIHGAIGVDTMEAGADDLRRVARFLAANGVTAWLPTLVPAPEEDYRLAVRSIEELMREQSVRSPASARVLGVHYEGPFINSAQCGALRPAYFRVFKSAADLDSLATLELEGAAHMMTLAPETAGGVELVRELRARGWIVSIGHTRAGVDVLDLACEAGARHMTHFMNAMLPLHHRAPGPVGWGLMRDDVSCDIIADGAHSDPLILRLVMRCKGAERVALISDAVAPAGLGDGDYEIWGETISVKDGRTSNARGHIAGSVITLRDAVRLLGQLGVTATEIALMAARTPARLLGVENECGSLETGKRADLVALDQDYNVRLTLVGGRVAFNKLPSQATPSEASG